MSKCEELTIARKRLINLSNYYGTLEKHNCSSCEPEELLEPIDMLCSSTNMYETFAQLVLDKQECLKLREASINFSISEMLQVIHIENTKNTSNTCDGVRELLRMHSPWDIVAACWTGFLNLLLSKEHTPSGNVDSDFGPNFSAYMSEGLCATDHDFTNFSDQHVDGWKSLLEILRGVEQLYIRIDIHSEPESVKSIIDLSTALKDVTLTLTDILCAEIQERDSTMHCLLNLIIYDVSLDYSSVQNNLILKDVRTLLLNNCKKNGISDDVQYDLFTHSRMETFGLLNSAVPLALLRSLVSCTPPIVKTGASTQCTKTMIKRLWFSESTICGDAPSDDEPLLRTKLALYYLLASVINLTLSRQLQDLCLPADLPLEAYEFLLSHGVSGIFFSSLRNFTIHKFSKSVSLATHVPKQTEERIDVDAFYTSCVKSNGVAIAEFLAYSGLEGLVADPYSILISNSDEQKRYSEALSLFSRRVDGLTDHQDACFCLPQSFQQQNIDPTIAQCTPGIELYADELAMLDKRVPAQRGTMLCGTLEPKVALSIAVSLSYFLIPYKIDSLSYSPTCLLTTGTLARMQDLSLSPSNEFHNCKLQVLCYAPFSPVTLIINPNHERLGLLRALLAYYTSRSPEPEIGVPANKNLADLCLNAVTCCSKYYEKEELNPYQREQEISSRSDLTVTLATGQGSVHAIIALTLVILLEMGFATAVSIDLSNCAIPGNIRESQKYCERYLSQIILFPYIKKIVLSACGTMLHLDNSSKKFVVINEDGNEMLYTTQSHGARRSFKR